MRGLRKGPGLCSLLLLFLMAKPQFGFAQNPDPLPSASGAATRHPTVPLSPEIQGDLLMLRSRYAAALDAYQRASDRSAVLLNKIGTAYHHLRAFDKAREYYQQALAMNPHYPEALNNLAAIYYSQRDLEKAERTYKEALVYEPRSAVILANLGIAYFADSKYRQGTEAYSEALKIDPGILHPDGSATVEEGATHRQAISSNYSLAKICAAAGRTEEAISYLRKALDEGLRNRKKLMNDKQFAALRSTPEFQQLLSEHPDR